MYAPAYASKELQDAHAVMDSLQAKTDSALVRDAQRYARHNGQNTRSRPRGLRLTPRSKTMTGIVAPVPNQSYFAKQMQGHIAAALACLNVRPWSQLQRG